MNSTSRKTPPALRLFAPAKINWTLAILRKRPDGYHDLDTIFQTLNWGDELRLWPLGRKTCRIRCAKPGVPLDERNLIHRAWRLLAETFPARAAGVEFELIKRLPAGGGLGGGSSDASAALAGLNKLWGLKLPKSELETLSAQLGSDCPFFIRGGSQRGTGRGEQLSVLKNNLPPVDLVIVCPPFPSATAAAYSQVTPAHYSTRAVANTAEKALLEGNLTKLQKNLFNVFNPIVTCAQFDYKGIHEQIAQAGLLCPMLAGSGSSLFCFAQNRAHAQDACRFLKPSCPESFAARLSRSGVRFLPPLEC